MWNLQQLRLQNNNTSKQDRFYKRWFLLFNFNGIKCYSGITNSVTRYLVKRKHLSHQCAINNSRHFRGCYQPYSNQPRQRASLSDLFIRIVGDNAALCLHITFEWSGAILRQWKWRRNGTIVGDLLVVRKSSGVNRVQDGDRVITEISGLEWCTANGHLEKNINSLVLPHT